MKKLATIFVLLTLAIFTLFSCTVSPNSDNNLNIIPESNISYRSLEIGNVIDEGKQAVFFRFQSDYTVTKIEFAGSLLDKNGNQIYNFDTSMGFHDPTKTPGPAIRIDAEIIKDVYSVSFTKVTAFTAEKINSGN